MRVIKINEDNNETYDEFIQNIIETRGQWADEVINSSKGCERHHIIPACMGGEGDYIGKNGRSGFSRRSHHPNCIYLYPAEHYMAHKLLYKKYPNIFGLYAAWVGTTKDGLIDMDDYADLKAYNHPLPQEILDKIDSAGEFHYMPRKNNRKTDRDISGYKKEQQRRRELGIGSSPGEKNGMYHNGDKISKGKNGHASIRYFYKDKVFESKIELLDYLHSLGINITNSAIRAVVHGYGTHRVYDMYKDVFDNLSWEYKA